MKILINHICSTVDLDDVFKKEQRLHLENYVRAMPISNGKRTIKQGYVNLLFMHVQVTKKRRLMTIYYTRPVYGISNH